MILKCLNRRLSKGPFIDYYKVLKISPSASDSEIKEAYFFMVKSNHPDVSFQSVEKIIQIYEAWKTLKNPETKKEYDKILSKVLLKEQKDSEKYNKIYYEEEDVVFDDLLMHRSAESIFAKSIFVVSSLGIMAWIYAKIIKQPISK